MMKKAANLQIPFIENQGQIKDESVKFYANTLQTTLPWLDFGSNLIWNSNTNTLSDGGLAFVDSLIYRDGTGVPPPFPPSPSTDPVIWLPVSLSISFSGNSGIGSVSIGSWFSADLTYSGPVVNPLGATPNPVIVNMSNISVTTGAGS